MKIELRLSLQILRKTIDQWYQWVWHLPLSFENYWTEMYDITHPHFLLVFIFIAKYNMVSGQMYGTPRYWARFSEKHLLNLCRQSVISVMNENLPAYLPWKSVWRPSWYATLVELSEVLCAASNVRLWAEGSDKVSQHCHVDDVTWVVLPYHCYQYY
jgi:hypothetical protein